MSQEILFATPKNTPDLRSPEPITGELNDTAVAEIRRLDSEEMELTQRRADIYQKRNAIRYAMENRSADGIREAVKAAREGDDIFAVLKNIKFDMVQSANVVINVSSQMPDALKKLEEIQNAYPGEVSIHEPFARRVRLLREDAKNHAMNCASTETRFRSAISLIMEKYRTEYEAAKSKYEVLEERATAIEKDFFDKLKSTSGDIKKALAAIEPGGANGKH